MSDDGEEQEPRDGRYELAQVNVMRLKAPLTSEQLQPFVAALVPFSPRSPFPPAASSPTPIVREDDTCWV
ncbi:MAG: hypothetical protein ABUR63_00175 [Verrucomicrobiota bacterium]